MRADLPWTIFRNRNVTPCASLWPDQIRNHDDPSTFPNWHFVDYPLIPPSFPDRGSPTPEDDILFGIGKSEAILRSPSAAAQDKAEKLSWLIHLVGDIHQPLHCATLVNSGKSFASLGHPLLTQKEREILILFNSLLPPGSVTGVEIKFLVRASMPVTMTREVFNWTHI